MTCVPAAIVNTMMPPIYLLACERPRNDLEALQSTYSPTVLTGRQGVANVGVGMDWTHQVGCQTRFSFDGRYSVTKENQVASTFVVRRRLPNLARKVLATRLE